MSKISFVHLYQNYSLFFLKKANVLEFGHGYLKFLFLIHSGLPASRPSELANGGTCTYVCKQNKFCNVNFNANGPFNGRTKGICFDYENRHDCEGTPRFCEDCASKCRGRVGATFSEVVGPKQ